MFTWRQIRTGESYQEWWRRRGDLGWREGQGERTGSYGMASEFRERERGWEDAVRDGHEKRAGAESGGLPEYDFDCAWVARRMQRTE